MQRKILLAIPALLVLLIMGGVVALKSMDFNAYRDQISEEVRKATGRQFSIDGDLDLKLSLNPALAVNGVRLGNAPWGMRPDMARIGRLEAQVALLPLLFGDIQVQRLVLIDADLMLETHLMGKGNWVFGEEGKQAPAEEGGASLPLVQDVEVRNLKVAWRSGSGGRTSLLELDHLLAQAEGASAPLHLELQGSWNKESFKAEGQLASLQELASGGALKLDLTIEAGGAKIKLGGAIAEPAAVKGIDLKLAAEGADLATLSGLAGAELPPIAPWKASLSLAGDGGAVRSEDIQLQLGQSDIAGTLSFTQREEKVPLLEAKLHSKLLDLDSLRGKKEEGEGQPKEKKEKVFSSAPLDLKGLKALDAVVDYRAERFITNKLEIANLEADLRLAGGVLNIKPLKAGIADSQAQGRLSLNGAAKPARLELKLDAKGLELAKLLKAASDEETITGKGDLAVQLKGQGNSVAAIMASLDGYARLLVGEGTLKTGAIDSLVGGLSTLVGTLVAEQKDTAAMHCLASDFDIKKGVATSRALLVDTEYSTVFGKGDIDLGQETLDLLMEPKPKSATLNVAVPVQVGGTLANPSFGVEKVAAARKAAGVLAVVGGLAFPPAALLGLGEMGTGEENPCLKIAQGGEKAAVQPTEEKKEEGGIKGAVEGLGNKIKGLFGN